MMNKIFNEMLVNIAINSHFNPKSVMVLGDFGEMAKEFEPYNIKPKVYTIELHNAIEKTEIGSQDIIIVDSNFELPALKKLLKNDAILAIKWVDIYSNIDATKKLMKELGESFKIVMPAIFKDNQSLLFASHKYHPTADMLLQRAEMIEPREYYNADFHKASFVYPNTIESLYKGLIKR